MPVPAPLVARDQPARLWVTNRARTEYDYDRTQTSTIATRVPCHGEDKLRREQRQRRLWARQHTFGPIGDRCDIWCPYPTFEGLQGILRQLSGEESNKVFSSARGSHIEEIA